MMDVGRNGRRWSAAEVHVHHARSCTGEVWVGKDEFVPEMLSRVTRVFARGDSKEIGVRLHWGLMRVAWVRSWVIGCSVLCKYCSVEDKDC
jgi:hypothetical protein